MGGPLYIILFLLFNFFFVFLGTSRHLKGQLGLGLFVSIETSVGQFSAVQCFVHHFLCSRIWTLGNHTSVAGFPTVIDLFGSGGR